MILLGITRGGTSLQKQSRCLQSQCSNTMYVYRYTQTTSILFLFFTEIILSLKQAFLQEYDEQTYDSLSCSFVLIDKDNTSKRTVFLQCECTHATASFLFGRTAVGSVDNHMASLQYEHIYGPLNWCSCWWRTGSKDSCTTCSSCQDRAWCCVLWWLPSNHSSSGCHRTVLPPVGNALLIHDDIWNDILQQSISF